MESIKQCMRQGDFEAAKQKAIEIRDKKEFANQKQETALLCQLAFILYNLKELQQAEEVILSLKQQLNSQEKACATYALILQEFKQYRKAEIYYKKANQIDRLSKKRSHNLLGNYADFLAKRGRYKQAQAKLLQSFQADGKYTDNPLRILQLAYVKYKMGEQPQARQKLRQAMLYVSGRKKYQFIEDLYPNALQFLRDSLEYLDSVYSMQGDEQYIQLKNRAWDYAGGVDRYEQKLKEQKQLKSKLQQCQVLYNKNQSKLKRLNDTVKKLKLDLQWDKDFQIKIEELNKVKKFKTVRYARNLSWRLAASIRAYRQLKLGVLGSGQLAISTTIGSYVKKLNTVIGLAKQQLPFGQMIQKVSIFGEIFLSIQRKQLVSKIVSVTNKLYTEKQISREISRAVYKLLCNTQFINKLEPTTQQAVLSRYKQYSQYVKGGLTKQLNQTNFFQKDLSESHCIQIISGLCKLQNNIDTPIVDSINDFCSKILAGQPLKPKENDFGMGCFGFSKSAKEKPPKSPQSTEKGPN